MKGNYFSLTCLILAGQFPNPPHPSCPVFCLQYVPIPEPQRGKVVEEYQHWLHIKLLDSHPNSYSIYFPSGLPSISFPLPLLNFLFLCLSLPLSFLVSLLLFPPLVFSHSPSLFSVPCHHQPTPTKTSHQFFPSLSLCCLFFFSPHPVWSGSQRSA